MEALVSPKDWLIALVLRIECRVISTPWGVVTQLHIKCTFRNGRDTILEDSRVSGSFIHIDFLHSIGVDLENHKSVVPLIELVGHVFDPVASREFSSSNTNYIHVSGTVSKNTSLFENSGTKIVVDLILWCAFGNYISAWFVRSPLKTVSKALLLK